MTEWSKEKVVEELRRLARELGRTPKWRDSAKLAGATQRHFGSWNEAKEAAGLDTLPPEPPKDSIKRLDPERILEAVEDGGPVTVPELASRFGFSRTTILERTRELEESGRVRTYYCALNTGRGSFAYKDSDSIV